MYVGVSADCSKLSFTIELLYTPFFIIVISARSLTNCLANMDFSNMGISAIVSYLR